MGIDVKGNFIVYGNYNHIDHVDNIFNQQSVTNDASAASPDLAAMTPTERATYAVRVLVREGAIHLKREWTAVMRVAKERSLLPPMSSADFVHLLAESKVPDKLMPSVSCIDKTYISKEFPNWEFVDIGKDDGERMKRIAERFVSLCTE